MQNQLLRLIENFDVVSFDVFDTLLLRPYLKPSDLFRKVAGEVFMKERIRAERKARAEAKAAGREEVLFDEIYEKLPQWCEVKQLELDEERRSLTANPEIVEVYNIAKAAGKKVVIASDMYLPKSFLEEVLRGQGVEGWDAFYLSCECGVQKAGGGMFKFMAEELGVRPDKILHIGDDVHADVQSPEQVLTGGWYYPKVKDRFLDSNPYARTFCSSPDEHSLRSHFVGTIAVVEHILRNRMCFANGVDSLSVLFGGVVIYLYAQWIVRTAREKGIRRLLFVARDGYTVKKVVESLSSEIQTDYIYAPRTISQCVKAGKAIPLDYIEYVRQLNIDAETSAIVDGNTEFYSSQRLLNAVLGREIAGFYFMATSDYSRSFAYIRNKLGADFYLYMFLEVFYCAPTLPVEDVKNGIPRYFAYEAPYERLRAERYHRISEIEIESAKLFAKFQLCVSPEYVYEWLDDFIYDTPFHYQVELAHLKNSVDVQHREYHSIVFPQRSKQRHIAIFGVRFITIRRRTIGFYYERAAYLFNVLRIAVKRTKRTRG